MEKELLERLDMLAAKLALTGDKLWSVLVHQARLEAWNDLFWAVLLLIVAAISGFWLYKLVNGALNTANGDFEAGVAVALAIITPVALLCSLFYFSFLPTELLNPDYWALTHLKQSLGL